jgi:hypothetical protein
MVPADSANALCAACCHNRTIPDITDPTNHRRWQKVEAAKRRLIYSLIKLRLPLPTVASGEREPLVFDILSDVSPGEKAVTGHDAGVITISLSEADDATREQNRVSMGEAYRTLLGHFRHEVGHYYWNKLVRDGGHIESCRAVFGDDRLDYGTALQRHYAEGPPSGWQDIVITAYASTHPWEDFAETFAHYIHIADTLETASSFGIRISPKIDNGTLEANTDFDSYGANNFTALINAWAPLTFVVNSLNRSMGQPDLYPFALSPPAVDKLGYIDMLVHAKLRSSQTSQ